MVATATQILCADLLDSGFRRNDTQSHRVRCFSSAPIWSSGCGAWKATHPISWTRL